MIIVDGVGEVEVKWRVSLSTLTRPSFIFVFDFNKEFIILK